MSRYFQELIMEDYRLVKEQLKQAIKDNPNKEHQLILDFSPVLNFHAMKYAEYDLKEIESKDLLSRYQERESKIGITTETGNKSIN